MAIFNFQKFTKNLKILDWLHFWYTASYCPDVSFKYVWGRSDEPCSEFPSKTSENSKIWLSSDFHKITKNWKKFGQTPLFVYS